MTISIRLPAQATVFESFELARLCDEAEQHTGELTIDCRMTTNLGPFGIALLAACVAMRRLAGHTTLIIPPADAAAAKFLDEMGLAAFASGTQTGIGTLEVRQLLALDASYTAAVTQMLIRGVPGMDEETSYPIQLCLNELLQNVFEWSKSSVGCVVLTRWYHSSRVVRIAVVDRGVGIPKALRPALVGERGGKPQADADVIEAAVTIPRLTSRANRVGGLGLKTIHETVTDRKGRVTVASLGAKVVWNGPNQRRFEGHALRGTGIEIEFRPTEPISNPREYVPVF